MIDASQINQTLDLLVIVEKETELKHNGGSWYSGPCPFCGGTDRFVLKHTLEGWRWFCRHCGSGKYHTPIDYIMRRENCDFPTAVSLAVGEPPLRKATVVEERSSMKLPAGSSTPVEAWQQRGLAFVETCEGALWGKDGIVARRYLLERGLKEDTLRRYRVGYHPTETFEPLEEWGLPEAFNQKGNLSKVWLPRGITLPALAGDTLLSVKIRRPLTKIQEKAGEQKYIKIKGSQPAVFGAENLRGAWLVTLTEGEFDCMLLDQEAPEFCPATLGSMTDRLEKLDLSIWSRYFLHIAYILAAYDMDSEGERGAEALAAFSERVHRVRLPEGDWKDISDFWKAKGDIGNWLAWEVDRLGLLENHTHFNLADELLKASDKAADQARMAEQQGDVKLARYSWIRFAHLYAAFAEESGFEPSDGVPWQDWVKRIEAENGDA